jgi:hypothetical protein
MAREKVEKTVDATKTVRVFGAESSKYLKTGKAYELHSVHATKLIEAKHATLKGGKDEKID